MSSKSVRIDEETYDRLHQLAEDEDRPMSRIVANGVDVYEQHKLAKISRPASPTTFRGDGEPANADIASGEGSPPAASAPQCPPHPESERKVRSWGAVCGKCGTVLR